MPLPGCPPVLPLVLVSTPPPRPRATTRVKHEMEYSAQNSRECLLTATEEDQNVSVPLVCAAVKQLRDFFCCGETPALGGRVETREQSGGRETRMWNTHTCFGSRPEHTSWARHCQRSVRLCPAAQGARLRTPYLHCW